MKLRRFLPFLMMIVVYACHNADVPAIKKDSLTVITPSSGTGTNSPDSSHLASGEPNTGSKSITLPSRYIGKYHGTQSKPAAEYVFGLDEGGNALLKKTGKEDKNEITLNGTYRITGETSNQYEVECSFDKNGNTLTTHYTLYLNKTGNNGISKGMNEPELPIERVKENTKEKNTEPAPVESTSPEPVTAKAATAPISKPAISVKPSAMKFHGVTISSQVWMLENLNVSQFRNGDTIMEARTEAQWQRAGDDHVPAWCYFNNDPANGSKFGKLYNWYAVNDPRGLAPQGWHVATDADWAELIDRLGGDAAAAPKLKAAAGWRDNNGQSGNGNNSSGFTGLPGGARYGNGGFYNSGFGDWWTATESKQNMVWYRFLGYNTGTIGRAGYYKNDGLSVRCVKD